MSDLFHKGIPKGFKNSVFETMEEADQHIYQILTKRSSLMRDYINERYKGSAAPPHIWLGVSVEDKAALTRVMHLQQTSAAVRFLSIEPLLGRIGRINLKGIHWVIVGGESGANSRPIKLEWVREIRDQCIEKDVRFFFKQWGGLRAKSGGNELDGRTWFEYPNVDFTPSTSGKMMAAS
jgi:protein gp37